MRAVGGLWRWRGNPLRRGTDLAEAWVALTALVLILSVAPLIGVLAGVRRRTPCSGRCASSTSPGTG